MTRLRLVLWLHALLHGLAGVPAAVSAQDWIPVEGEGEGEGESEGVAPAGVAVSWVWLQTFRWAQRDYKAATAAGYTGCEQQTTEERCMHAPRGTAGLSSPK